MAVRLCAVLYGCVLPLARCAQELDREGLLSSMGRKTGAEEEEEEAEEDGGDE